MNKSSLRDRKALQRNFNRASATFDGAAVLHRELRERLLARLQILPRQPHSESRVIVDLGAGTGQLGKALQQQFSKARIVAVDLAESMLRHTQATRSWRAFFANEPHRVCADACALPLRDASADWIVSNAMLQWCAQPEAVFAEVRRVLKPGGLFSFTTFGPDTLHEMRSTWVSMGSEPPTIDFVDMHNLGDAVLRSGLSDPVFDIEYFKLTYPTFAALAAELKATGSTYPLSNSRGLRGKRHLTRLAAAYEEFRSDTVLPVTVEAIFGLAWQPIAPPQKHNTTQQSETLVPLAALRNRKSSQRP